MAAPFDSTLFKSIKQTGDGDGGHFAAAVQKSDSSVWTSWSADGVTWSTPVPATDELGDPMIITVDGKGIVAYQESAANSTRFVVTNGGGFMIYSDAFGAADSWSNY